MLLRQHDLVLSLAVVVATGELGSNAEPARRPAIILGPQNLLVDVFQTCHLLADLLIDSFCLFEGIVVEKGHGGQWFLPQTFNGQRRPEGISFLREGISSVEGLDLRLMATGNFITGHLGRFTDG